MAILLVLGYHCWQLLGFEKQTEGKWIEKSLFFPLSSGWVGVSIFFVISGFCIHLSHVRSKKKGWTTFFQRRFFRIYPPYFISFLGFALLFPATRVNIWSFDGLMQFVTHLSLIHNFNPITFAGINPALWSIAVEVQLYVLYPLLIWIKDRIGWGKCMGLLIVLALISIKLPSLRFHAGLPTYWDWLQMGPFRYWISWIIGAKIADDWIAGRKIFLSDLPLWIPSVIFLASCAITGKEKFSFNLGAFAAGTAIAHLLARPDYINRFLKNRFFEYLRVIGLFSYSLYLLHQPFLLEISELVKTGFLETRFVGLAYLAATPFILLIAWIFTGLLSFLPFKLESGSQIDRVLG